jgi:translocation and assembly module TamB
VALVLLVATGAAVTGWLWQSNAGLRAIVALADRALPARLTVQQASGSLADGFAFEELVYASPDVMVRVERLHARLDDFALGLSLAALRFDFGELLAERVTVQVRPKDAPSAALPASIASPVRVSAQRLAVGVFDYRTAAAPAPALFTLRGLDTRAAIGPDGYHISEGRVGFGPAHAPLQAQLSGKLGGAPPFVLDVRGRLSGSLRERPLQADLQASGSLVDLLLNADVREQPATADVKPAADAPRGRLVARLASFDALALRALSADLANIDPAAWIAGAPTARLAVRAELEPRPGADFTVGGPVQVDNLDPGPIDRRRIPVRRARAQITASANALAVADIAAELVRGSARGRFDIDPSQPAAWRAQVTFSGVDPAALHSRLRPFTLDGQATVVHRQGDTAVSGQARNRAGLPLQATVDLHASAQRVRIDAAQLTLGRGSAHVRGEVQLMGARGARLTGSVVELDTSLLAAGLEARLTGSFEVDGVLAPTPAGRASFALTDSQVFGRPLAGRGALTLADDASLDVDAALSMRSARLTARGGLGAAGRSLALELVAPQVADLGLPLSGRVTAHALLTGAWQAPAVDAQVEAAALRVGDHRIGELQAVASYGGGSDGTLALQASAVDHRFRTNPMLSLQTATLRADGRLSAHRIELAASNEEAQPVTLELAGGWQPAAGRERARWQGEVRRATAGKPLDLQLGAAAPLSTDFSQWSIGPIDMTLAGARVEQARVEVADGVFSTSGRFADLRPSALRSSTASALLVRGAAPPPPTTLRGHWQLRLGAQADGNLLIERSGGDIVAGSTPMGLTDLRAEAVLKANRLQASALLAGTVAGRAEAQLAAEVEHSEAGWRLAQQRPLAASLDLDLPSIAWVNSLLSETVRANVRIGGELKGGLRVDGTPAEPSAKGAFSGSGLRVAWVEQGMRLENGTLTGRVDGNTIVLDELKFVGKPLVAPGDRRAAQALAREKSADDGLVALNGQLQLRDLSGVLQVRAVRMPFLQRADRWVVATGGANIVFDQKRVQLNGAVAANAGFVDFSRSDLPSLSGDVQVVRASEPATSREAPIGLNFDIGIDLGEGFYLRGAGLDSRIEGQARLRADGRGAIRATGTVEAKDGIYEGFGQKLAIERGRVNFQGPLENPGLDVLALRRGLPVDVGVSITRTAANPLIKLYSSEPMADHQILSWLVLGRAAEDTDPAQDRVALATAAAGLLAGGGEGISTQLARRLGVDEFSLRTGAVGGVGSLLPRSAVAGSVRGSPSTVSEEIVTVGKRLSENVTISYERATSGADNLVQIAYRLTQRLSVLARAGTENALNLVYTFTFD